MKKSSRISFILISLLYLALVCVPMARAELLKPFVLGRTLTGDSAAVTDQVKTALQGQGFTVVGSYVPFAGATVICASHPALIAAAAKKVADNGGFGLAQRVAVTEVDGVLQVSYVNPAYMGAAYGLGPLAEVSTALTAALGREEEFGAQGVKEKKLAPGRYHYAPFMPYFDDISVLNSFADYQTAVAVVEENLRAGKGGTSMVYRIDLDGQEVTLFGVGIPTGDGPDSGAKDTDKELLDIIDYKTPRSIAYLPYEIMIKGNQAIALRGRYRIAVYFPDTSMAGTHGFTRIMSSPKGIKVALEAVAGK
ncbi:MAG: hypothetical protein L3J03_02405 [Desulfobacterales bacterium]|nr:hypothetical protein [Desulfobacterales bacterium]